MKRINLIFALFTLLLPVEALISINEIHYDPTGTDNNQEFVEVYSDVSLENYTIEDIASSDSLLKVKNFQSNFSLIVEEGFDFSEIDANIYAVGATIGNGLNNDRDIILLKNIEGKVVDAFSYTEEFGGDGNGMSLCRIPDFSGKFQECTPSPGNSNSNKAEYKLKINEFMPDPEGNDSASMPEGEWIEIYNFGDAIVDLENFRLEDDFGHKIFISDSQVKDTTIIEGNDFLVVYTNGKFGFLNNEDFEAITLFDNNGDLVDKVSYDGSSEGTSWALVEDKWILSNPTPFEENPSEEDLETDSKMTIDTVYLGVDEIAKWGDALRVKLIIYKGDTGKESVQAWIQNNDDVVSKRTSTNIHKKFVNHEITIPIQIHPNCKEGYEDGKYEIIVTGLDAEAKENIEIDGLNSELCDQASIKTEKAISYELLKTPSRVNSVDNFEVLLKITNNDDAKKRIDVWTQVVDGDKIVSKMGKDDKVSTYLPGGGSSIVELTNEIQELEVGEYELVVGILEDGKSRSEYISQNLRVDKTDIEIFESNINAPEENEITGKTIYISQSGKEKKLALYLFIFLLSIMGVYGVVKK